MQHNKMHIHGLGTTMVPGLYISYFGFQTQMKKVNLHFNFEELVCCVYLFNCLHYRTGRSWCCFPEGETSRACHSLFDMVEAGGPVDQ